ncbi:fatty acid-binding protein [Dermatophagoides farinae]|uniref:Der f 13 allergen n=1 Tax=Dermatophagoides farinae TaxID=6954 RepID=A1KXH1_DERFA|nr:fatty acid-binding protein-like [Dermatophagoides farinae]AAP35074.1 Der f 13 allergen [Dermatophagoides farinae]KAH7640603.1 der f 13 allergen [Dermatophagoides farinae]KAH9526115.1 Lipocalin / cytosolic fatty-acid binding protein [Dermatophagoides farinae]
MLQAIPENFYGKYKLATSENFDNFLKEIGVGLVKRKLANTTYPTVEFIKDQNDSLIFKSHTVIKTSETKFKLGEEFDEDRLDGKRVKSVVEFVGGNQLIQTQRDGDMEIKYIREFNGEQIKVTSIANDVKCLRVYQRVAE